MVQVFYKCRCMAKETEISVPDRRPLADMSTWFPLLQFCVSGDHQMLSPHCKSPAMEYVKLAYEEGRPLGQPDDKD